ncbi:adhesin biosynthesis transcription regulatory family protein [Citrobacter cronae]|nr:adhesin biosynthesis transcription regulatory family protein [Citrobacter cronae]
MTKLQLLPGSLTPREFELFIALSSIRSKNAICALKDYYVNGHSRNTVCINNNVSQGYLSLKIKECAILNGKINAFFNVYHKKHDIKISSDVL